MKGVSYTASSCSEGGEGQGAESQCVSWGFLSLLKGVPYMVSSWGGVWLGRGGGSSASVGGSCHWRCLIHGFRPRDR